MTVVGNDLRVLIVGGYGTFGGRIVQLLQDKPRLTLIVAGRSLERATAFRESRRGAPARIVAAAFDRDGDLPSQIASHHPDILVDASGPFQAYGESRYRLVEACVALRVNYLDLADGSDFVAEIGSFDRAARAADIFVLSGVSSFLVLTAAAVRRLTADMTRMERIRGEIAPSPFAIVGENVIRAIAGYAGKPILLRREGKQRTAYPWTEQTRFTIAPPGHLPLWNKMFSLVDVPDPRVLPQLWPEVKSIWMGAGPVPEILHRLLVLLAWAVRLRLVPSISPLTPLMRFVVSRLRRGENRGGMFVDVTGRVASGVSVKRSWHLIAEGDDGPLIPSMAIEAIVRKILAGQIPPTGARAAVRELELDDYQNLFLRRTIYTGIRNDPPLDTEPLYQRILGTAWANLPTEIRTMHTIGRASLAEGSATVERGRGLLSRLAAIIFGFPASAETTHVTVAFEASSGIETWTRTFGDRRFSSRQSAGRGRSAHLLVERFGPLTFAIALVIDAERLSLVMRRWSVFSVPLPMCLGPRSIAYETVEDGRFHFNVEISHPLTGLIIRYRGWLTPASMV